MFRTAGIAVPDTSHQVTQQGNSCQDVFFVDDGRRVYLSILKEQSEKFALKILGWCLMTDHIHLIGSTAVAVSVVHRESPCRRQQLRRIAKRKKK